MAQTLSYLKAPRLKYPLLINFAGDYNHRMAINIKVANDKAELGKLAASFGANKIREAIATHGAANIIVATGASQFEMLEHLIREPIAWQHVSVFHLDEYVGLSIDHPASFRQYLWKRFASQLPLPTAAFHYLDGENDPVAECDRVSAYIKSSPIDVAFVGIGENGHLAFNDPPADFETESPYLVVELDEACRRQQFGEGWFSSLDEVPRQAISMSIRQIIKSSTIVCSVPDERKSEAVRGCLENEVSPDWPASILRTHADCHLFLDPPAASKLDR